MRKKIGASSINSIKTLYSLLYSLFKSLKSPGSRRALMACLIIFAFLFAFISAGHPLTARAEEGLEMNNWWQSLRSGHRSQVFNLEYEELVLPDDEFKSFSEKGQDKLFDLARQYGDEGVNRDEISDLFIDESFASYRDEDEGKLNLSSRFNLIAADNAGEERDDPAEALEDLNLEFNFGERTTFVAGLERSSTSGLDARNIISDEEASDKGDISENDVDWLEALNRSEQSESEEERSEEFEEEEFNIIADDISANTYNDTSDEYSRTADDLFAEGGSVGLVYEPLDFLSLSAGLSKSDILNSEGPDSAALGLELSDQLGNFRASYRVEEGQSLQQTTTGVELELMDFAMLSASYSLLDMDEIEDKLEQQTGVDLGLDLNFTNFSSLSLGYQWQENLLQAEEIDGDYESNIRASFTIDF